MTINEHQRYQLHQALDTHLGPENAATLMAYLPPVGWADVATKHDLQLLRSDLGVLRGDLDGLEKRIGLRLTAEIAGVRGELGTEIAGLRSELHKSLRTMKFTFVGATAGIVTVIAALTNLFS